MLRGHKMNRKVIEYEVAMLHVLILQYVLHKMKVNLNHPGSETSPHAHGYISPTKHAPLRTKAWPSKTPPLLRSAPKSKRKIRDWY